MKKCLVEVYNNKTKKTEWVEGEIIGTRSGDTNEDFERIDIRVKSGIYEGCHPKCVKTL